MENGGTARGKLLRHTQEDHPTHKISFKDALNPNKESIDSQAPSSSIDESYVHDKAHSAWQRLSARFSKKASKVAGAVSGDVLAAYMGFKDPKKKKREYLIPKDRAAWLEWMVILAKKRASSVEYLSDKELRKVIIRARPNLSTYKGKGRVSGNDPDLPSCYTWNEEQVGEWIESMGWPHLKDTFVNNVITGRKLVMIDCAALSQMGMYDLASMREVAKKIRELLGIPPPNHMRPLMRISPYESFLRQKVGSGRSYDDLTFQRFCETEGYNYELVLKNKNMLIPCTAEVTIVTPEHIDSDEEGDGLDDESLRNAPSVEFLVRNAMVRNKTVDQIMDDIMESVFLPSKQRKYGKELWGQLKRGIGEGFDDLHFRFPQQRLEFAAGVANSLIEELYKTVAVLNDINDLEKHINENITKADMDMFRSCARTLMEEALPIVALLALGELDLDKIFRQEPEFQIFVKEIVQKAEKMTNELVPDATVFVDQVISQALERVSELDLSELKPETRESLLKMTDNMASHLKTPNSAAGVKSNRSSTVRKGQIRFKSNPVQQEPVLQDDRPSRNPTAGPKRDDEKKPARKSRQSPNK